MKVFLKETIHEEALKLLEENAEVTDDEAQLYDIDAVIVRAMKVDRNFIEKAPKLKVIAKHGVGYNNIDLESARERGIKVLYTPKTNINSVAELVIGLAFTLYRHINMADSKCRKNAYKKIAPNELCGLELTGKTLGLIGTGNIARLVAEKMHAAFDMQVLGYDPYISSEMAKNLGIKKIDTVMELIQRSDVVSISVPLTAETKDMISGEVFDSFKPNAILINTARGGIVNEGDLYAALNNGKLFGAAMDSFETEPPTSDNPLLALDNFCATPHIGGTTEEALYRTGMQTVRDTLSVLNGGKAENPVI